MPACGTSIENTNCGCRQWLRTGFLMAALWHLFLVAGLQFAPLHATTATEFLEFTGGSRYAFPFHYRVVPVPELYETAGGPDATIGSSARVVCYVLTNEPATLTSARDHFEYFKVVGTSGGSGGSKDSVLPVMANSPSVDTLVVSGFHFDERVRAFVESWKSIKSFEMDYVPYKVLDTNWTDAVLPMEELTCCIDTFLAIAQRAEALPNLRHLRLRGLGDATKIAEAITRFRALEELDIVHVHLDSRLMAALAALPHLRSLGVRLGHAYIPDADQWSSVASTLTSFRMHLSRFSFDSLVGDQLNPLEGDALVFARNMLRLVNMCEALVELETQIPLFDVGSLSESNLKSLTHLNTVVLSANGLNALSRARNVSRLKLQIGNFALFHSEQDLMAPLALMSSLQFLHLKCDEIRASRHEPVFTRRHFEYFRSSLEGLVLEGRLSTRMPVQYDDSSPAPFSDYPRLRFLDVIGFWESLDDVLAEVVRSTSIEGLTLTWMEEQRVPWQVLEAVSNRPNGRLTWLALKHLPRMRVDPRSPESYPMGGVMVPLTLDAERLLKVIQRSGAARVNFEGIRVDEARDGNIAFVKQLLKITDLRIIEVGTRLIGTEDIPRVTEDEPNSRIVIHPLLRRPRQ
jgi:hypothetical protein